MINLQHPLNIFWACMLLHLIADYTLQGCLANLKQKRWWHEQLRKLYDEYNGKDKSYEWKHRLSQKYKYDYLVGLACHALMWSIVTYLPLMLVCTPKVFSIVVVANTIIHLIIDDLKANRMRINLWQDQLLHCIQIVVTIAIIV